MVQRHVQGSSESHFTCPTTFVLQLSPPCTYISMKKISWQRGQKHVKMSSNSSLTWKIRVLGSHRSSQHISPDGTYKNISQIKLYCASYTQKQNRKVISSPTVCKQSSITIFCNKLVGEEALHL